jgi:hypothetical protein
VSAVPRARCARVPRCQCCRAAAAPGTAAGTVPQSGAAPAGHPSRPGIGAHRSLARRSLARQRLASRRQRLGARRHCDPDCRTEVVRLRGVCRCVPVAQNDWHRPRGERRRGRHCSTHQSDAARHSCRPVRPLIVASRRYAGARPLQIAPSLSIPSLLFVAEMRRGPFGNRTTLVISYVRRRPTLPRSGPRSTIGAERLSFRVRDGTGRFPLAMVAETLWRYGPHRRCGDRTSGTAQWTRNRLRAKPATLGMWQVLGLLVPVSYTCCHASTSGLSTRWSSRGPYSIKDGRSNLEAGFPLRCFQRLSLPNVANQQCSWWNNWHTRGSSVPVLSY